MNLINVQTAFNRATPVVMPSAKTSNLLPILIISSLALGTYFFVVSFNNREEKN